MSVCTVSPGLSTSGPQNHVEIPKMRMVGKTRYLKAVLRSNPSAAIYSACEPALTLCADGAEWRMLCVPMSDRANIMPLDHAGSQEVRATSEAFDTLNPHTTHDLQTRRLTFLALRVVRREPVPPHGLPSPASLPLWALRTPEPHGPPWGPLSLVHPSLLCTCLCPILQAECQ